MASVRKRTWESKGEKKSAWIADYFDQLGKRRQKTFARKKDADAWLLETRTQVNQGVHTPDRDSITISNACDLWLQKCQATKLERSTLVQYRSHVEAHIRPSLGKVKLSKLTTPMVEQFKDEILAKLSKLSAKFIMTNLSAIVDNSKRLGYVAQNVVTGVKIPGETREAPSASEGQMPSKDEVRRMVETAKGWFRVFLITAASTGMRSSEIRGLEWDAINFRRRTVSVRQRADKWGNIGRPKSKAGHRDIPLSDVAATALREWQRECPVFSNAQFVFPAKTGSRPRRHDILTKEWDALQLEVGLVDAEGQPKYVFHALRHFFASWAIEQGFSPKRLQTLLGHSSILMTFDVYGHLFPSIEDDHAKFGLAAQAIFGCGTSATRGV